MTQLPGRGGQTEKPRLLMVDDSKVMRTAARKMLGDRFDVVVAEDGEEGWRQIKSDHSIQVVFSDLSMPNLDGYGLLERVRTSPDAGIAGLPVIIVTGEDNDDAARHRALDMGATDFITKPFNSTDLLARATAHANYQRERKVLEETTTIDALTGLGNQQFLKTRLRQELAFAARHNHSLSLVQADVDGFNRLFIKAGKEAADAVLKQVAEIIAKLIRKEDTAGRMGLAQFVIALPTADAGGAKIFAERLCRKVEAAEIIVKGKRIPVTLSVGAMMPEPHPGQTARSVLEELNLVVQAASEAGGNRAFDEADVRGAENPVLPSSPEPPAEKEFPRVQVSVDEALEMIESGRLDEVESMLPALKRRLMPLLKLLQAAAAGGGK